MIIMPKFETIILEIEEHKRLAIIYFNRPKSLNALNYNMVREFCQALEVVSKMKSLRCLILTGIEKTFSVGGDINEFKNAVDPGVFMYRMANKLNEAVKLLKYLNIPLIAAINGLCFGAALGYACACDLRICHSEAKFGAAFTRIALSPDTSTSFHLPKIVGPSLAKEMILMNRILNSEEAVRYNLVSQIISADYDFLEEIKKLAVKLTKGAPIAIAKATELVNKSYLNNLEEHLELEKEYIKICADTEDFQEGLKAFLEKREPKFIGK